jgi:hypothetical protein
MTETMCEIILPLGRETWDGALSLVVVAAVETNPMDGRRPPPCSKVGMSGTGATKAAASL